MTQDALRAGVKALLPEIARRAPEFETARKVPPDMVQTFSKLGLFRLGMPKALGGLEAPPRHLVELCELLAQADGSAAWVAMICATTGSTCGSMSPALTARIFADPDPILCGVFARRGKAHDEGDHYRIEGRWQWGSGSDVAHWITGGCVVYRDGAPVMGADGVPLNAGVFVPVKDVALQNNWDVAGLCATGSQDFVMTNLRVPKDAMLKSVSVHDGPLFRFPAFGLLAAGVVSVMLGLARASIVEAMTIAGVKVPEAHRRVLAQRSRTQEDMATAEARLRAARAFYYEMLDRAWDETAHRGAASIETRRDLRMSIVHAARESVAVVDMMYGLGGGTSVYKTSPLQRIFRDIHVASQHMQVATPVMELAGRHMLGLEGDYAQL